jgi:ribosomal-protein-alanine N-acetyltransferase
MSVILETERLRLSTWGDAAVDELAELHGHPDVVRALDPEGVVWSREKAAQRLAGWLEEYRTRGVSKFRLSRRDDGAFVGRAGFSPYGDDTFEIGYALVRTQWGQGYATEAARGLSDWFFANRADDQFIGFAWVGNTGSLAVLEKIDMTRTHVGEVVGLPHQFFVKRRAA